MFRKVINEVHCCKFSDHYMALLRRRGCRAVASEAPIMINYSDHVNIVQWPGLGLVTVWSHLDKTVQQICLW